VYNQHTEPDIFRVAITNVSELVKRWSWFAPVQVIFGNFNQCVEKIYIYNYTITLKLCGKTVERFFCASHRLV